MNLWEKPSRWRKELVRDQRQDKTGAWKELPGAGVEELLEQASRWEVTGQVTQGLGAPGRLVWAE